MRLLLLGGTSEARELAADLVDAGIDVTSSLAGRVARPRLPVGKVRIGGFGGVPGLRAALVDFDAVVDATHPFALGMTVHAAAACKDLPLLRLERPGWARDPSWHYLDTHSRAASTTASVGRVPSSLSGDRSSRGSCRRSAASRCWPASSMYPICPCRPLGRTALGRHIAAELVLNPWSMLIEIDTIGIDRERQHRPAAAAPPRGRRLDLPRSPRGRTGSRARNSGAGQIPRSGCSAA